MNGLIEHSSARRLAPWKWGVCWLMFAATMLNYMDRQAMGSTAPFVKAEFKLDNEGYGRVELAFGLAYGIAQVCAGWLVDRVSVRWMYAAAVMSWSLTGFLTGFVPDAMWLIVCRAMLGVCEAPNWPLAVRTVNQILPARDRALGNGIFNSGGAAGAVLTPLLISALVPKAMPERWRLVFQLVGLLGSVWVVAWLFVVRGEKRAVIEHGDAALDSEPQAATSPVETSFWSLFLNRRIWLVLVVSIAVNACWHFYRVWLPLYLSEERGFDKNTTMQYAVAAYYVAADAGSLSAGWITRRLVVLGLSIIRARWFVMLGCAMLTSLSVVAVNARSDAVLVAVLMLVALGNLGQFAIFFAASQDVSPRHTALVLGLMGTVAWLCTATLQPYAGRLADRLGTFVPMLIGIGFVPIAAVLALAFWPTAAERAPSTKD
jgi:ACS family hexuronate transporter-like MFS transporter